MNWHLERQRRTDLPTRMKLQQVAHRLEAIRCDWTLDDRIVREHVAASIAILTEVERYLCDPQLVWRSTHE